MLSIKIPAVTSYCINSLLRSRTIGSRSSKLRFPQPSLKTSVRRFSSLSSLTWPVEKVRDQFIDYFVDKHDHVNYKSSPCVPVNDPTLLFANAGMNQFKPIFIGTVDPNSPLSSLKRVVNTQKCIRAGGKHNDLEDVGKDTYHHTFFEMLGTWSFGNYFKKEAIDWAYDLLVNHYKLDPNRLYASYFAGDEGQGLPCDTEARDYWLQYLPPERVLPFDKKANFWEMGDTGPCGPCSEIHYDRIGNRDASALVNADDPNVIEIWNLVFIQFNRENNGQLKALPNKHIDTGMGLERLTSILQNVPSNYDTDVFVPIFDAISREIGCSPYSGKLGKDDASQNYRDTAYRVIADHLRTISFAITDGAYPSNEGRGYVLRRVLRRAVRYGMQTLGGKPGFFSNLIPFVVNHFSKTFPELNNKVNEVVQVVREEELSFAALLEKGIKYFNDVVSEQQRQGKTIIEGETAFFLYDTLGFPIDLTQIMASEKGFSVDLNRFQQLMNEQKERGRKATSLKRLEGRDALVLQPDDIAYLQKTKNIPPTIDQYKYSSDYATPLAAKLEAIYTSKDKFQERFRLTSSSDDTVIGIILDQTNFYAESGGQIADTGKFEIVNGQGERIVLDVLDTQVYGGYVLHSCVPSSDSIFGRELSFSVKDAVLSSVDAERRKKIAPNHSMTHVLNYALRKTLGEGIDQKGSLVSDEKLRFDFSYPKAMTKQDLERVEAIVNDIINKQYTVSNGVIPLSQAKKIAGLRAVFGEVYPDPVRVLSIGAKIDELTSDPSNEKWKDYSIEFCGGIHLTNTADAQRFVIVEETAVAKGIRRITAVTRETARDIEKHSKQLLATSLQLEEELNQLMNSLSQKNVHVNNNLWKFDDDDRRAIQSLDDKLGSLRQETETSSTSVTLLSQIKEKNDVIVKQLFQLKNQELQSTIRSSVQSIAQEITSSQSSNSIAVYVLRDLPIENGKISKLISDEINKIDPNASFVCILPNSTVNKVSVFSSLQPSVLKARSDFSAPKLLQQLIDGVSELASGRCGGKGGFAQGSLQPLSSSSEYEQLVKNVLTKAREIVDSKQ